MQFSGKWICAPDDFLNRFYKKPQTGIPTGKWLISEDYVRMIFRKDFFIEDIHTLISAKAVFLYDFACEICINGVQIEKEADITPLCKTGRNTIGVRCYMANRPESFLMALCGGVEMAFAHRTEQILTDESWQAGYVYWDGQESENWHSEPVHHASRMLASDISPTLLRHSLYLRRDFSLEEEVISAKVWATAKGFYSLYINGQQADDSIFNPGITPVGTSGHTDLKHNNIMYYQEYDITPLLRKGENTIGVMTANGWYGSECHSTVRTAKHEFLAEAEILYKSGRKETISTDRLWRVTLSPLTQDDLQLGERVDARLETEDWNRPGADLSQWGFAQACGEDFTRLRPQTFSKVRIAETLKALAVLPQPDGSVLYDFGQNNSGRAQLNLKNTRPGQKITLEYFELLNKQGVPVTNPYENVFYRRDTQPGAVSPWAMKNIDCYLCKGAKEETYRPLHAYTGFRYVRLRGYEGADEDTVLYNVFHTDLPRAASFACSNPLLEKIWEITSRSFISNFHCGPTDCPTREKNFWNGDLQMFLPAALWMYGVHDALKAWTTEGRKLYAGCTAWIDEDYITPWMLYLFYGDTEVLAANYEKIKNQAEYRITLIDKGELNQFSFGDHAPPAAIPAMDGVYFNMLYYYRSLDTIGKIAGVLGQAAEAERYAAYAARLKEEINKRYYKEAETCYCDELYASQVFALAFGIAEGEKAEKVCAVLNSRIQKDGYKWNLGTASAAYLLNVLSQYGYFDTAYQLAVQTEYPSHGYMVQTGATTLYEGWEHSYVGSYNHYFKGTVCRWYVEYLGGIQPPAQENIAFAHIIIRPHFYRGLDFVEVAYQSVKGEIASSWKRENGRIKLTVKIPDGCRAQIFLPADGGEKAVKAGGGEHSFII